MDSKQYFQGNPVRLDTSRSRFNLSHDWTGTFNTGKAIPFLAYSDILPGDTFKLNCAAVIRGLTPVAPVMGNAYLDIAFFFVPYKDLLSRAMMSPSVNDSNHSWAAFIGAQDSLLNMPLPGNDVRLPGVYIYPASVNLSASLKVSDFVPKPGSLADMLGYGLPFSGFDLSAQLNSQSAVFAQTNSQVSCLEPLSYFKVWNDFYRDPNTMTPITYSVLNRSNSGFLFDHLRFSGGSFDKSAASDKSFIGDSHSLLDVCRFHGYFGSALPWPQRNAEGVQIPFSSDEFDIVGSTSLHDTVNSVRFASSGSGNSYLSQEADNSLLLAASSSSSSVNKTNLVVNTDKLGLDVSALRFSVQLQRWYEALARGGNRIGELTASMFGVTPKDISDGKAEFLGGKRIPIVQSQVVSTAAQTEGGSGLGTVGATSHTTDIGSYFTKSFDTWGCLIGIACVRTDDQYFTGRPRRTMRANRFDFYWPQFANLGEQPILKSELSEYAKNSGRGFAEVYASSRHNIASPEPGDVFGYQEAWAEYRYWPSVITSLVSPSAANANVGQAYWSYATNNQMDEVSLGNFLNASFQKADVDNTLAVSSEVSGFQWLMNAHFDIVATRPMPMYSIPGLVDHH